MRDKTQDLTFCQKLENARTANTAAELAGGQRWDDLAETAYYLTELCDTVQERHNEHVQHIHKGATTIAPKWAIIQKSRRMGCGRWAKMAHNVERSRAEIIDTRLCGLRTCPICAKITANRNERRITKTLQDAEAKKVSRDGAGYKLLGVTYTVPNCTGDELRAELQNIGRAVRSILQGNKDRNRVTAITKGYVYSLEVTRNHETGLYHPHVHIVLAVNASYGKGKEYISKAEWAEIWAKYSHRETAASAQYVRVVKKIHQAVKYVTKMTHDNLTGEDKETEDAAAAADNTTWTGDKEFDADTLYWIETACKGLQMTGTGGVLKTKLSDVAQEVTQEDVEALEDEGKHVYMLQDWERIKSAYAITGRSEELYTAKEVKAEKERISKAKSEASKAAWQRRKAIEAAEAAMLPEEIVSMRKAKEETERIMENVRMYTKAGMTGKATEEAGKLPKERQKEALNIITEV